MQPIEQVIDENGAIHRLARRVGAGGQGEVWLTEGGRHIVKLLPRGRDPDAMRRQFLFVRRLDLGALHVARPLAVLRPPHIGYVAEFLADMAPIESLMRAPAKGVAAWYSETGGLRRRLRLLAHAGEALQGLHGRGVVYADVSPKNVFVSAPVHAHEAWLIDLDNLSHESDHRRAIYTPGFGAPELVAGKAGCTTLSDAWAFAVLVWQLTTLGHPFVGDLVVDGEPELEAQAFAGALPWTRHSSDRRNESSSGLPPELVLADRLEKLASRTFEGGVSDRKQRPSVGEWVDRLHAAADQTVRCSECSGTYFVREQTCPWCEAPAPSVVAVRIVRWQPDRSLGKGLADAVSLGKLPLTKEGLVLSRRLTDALVGPRAREPQVELALVDRGISISAVAGSEVWVAQRGKEDHERHRVEGRARIVPPRGWMLFFDSPDRPQRVALLGEAA